MAKKKPKQNRQRQPRNATSLPYTTTPNALRVFLKEIPKRPRPMKVNNDLLHSWGFTDSNANSIIRVLKAVDLVAPNNDTTERYKLFMDPTTGSATLGEQVRVVYKPLFDASHDPHTLSDEELKRLFNIHAPGGEDVVRKQIQTFKVLCEFSSFTATTTTPQTPSGPSGDVTTKSVTASGSGAGTPSIHIDLHIHLPENRSQRDYTAIIEDIARFIYQREDVGSA